MSSVRVRHQLALREAELIFAQEIRPALNTLGDELISRVRSKMREDTGRERGNVKKRLRGSTYRLSLEVYGDTPQTLVDEYGRRPGAKMPPFKRGTPLYKWVGRKGIGAAEINAARETAQRRALRRKTTISQAGFDRAGNRGAAQVQEEIARRIAMKIARDGIPARKPFERTAQESQKFIRGTIDAAINRAVVRLNA